MSSPGDAEQGADPVAEDADDAVANDFGPGPQELGNEPFDSLADRIPLDDEISAQQPGQMPGGEAATASEE
ncbi:MAG: hypothetical protein MI919_05915 [Holophagales bacterium]|nr:hypothetical protein [Holophagales bacterium]